MSAKTNLETRGSLLLAWQVRNKHCLVIGSGEVALSRIQHLIIAQANITVIAGSKLHPGIEKLNEQGKIYKLIEREYQTSDLTMYAGDFSPENLDLDAINEQDFDRIRRYTHDNKFEVVCCCIDDHVLSTKIYYQCKALGINANIADKPELCDFYFGSMINKDNLQIMISSNGKSPRLLRMIKDTILKQIDVDVNKAIENLNVVRSTLRETKLLENDTTTIELRMNWIKEFTDFFSIKQWSEVDITPERGLKIVQTYPDYPPREYEAFKEFLATD